jgi:DNA-binding NarL/FixJ family response regulator
VIRVLIADDQELVRTGFRVILSAEPDIEVVGEAADGRKAIEAVRTLRPEIVVMDIRMPNLDGIEATRAIAAVPGAVRVLILTTFDLDEYVYEALRAGASGFLLKDAHPEELLAGIRAVAEGDAVIAPALTRRLLDAYAHHLTSGPQERQNHTDPRLDRLTDREREILVAIGHGWTNGEIAERLVLSESTVKTHVGRVLAKIGARDRVQAVIFAYDLGLTRPNTLG